MSNSSVIRNRLFRALDSFGGNLTIARFERLLVEAGHIVCWSGDGIDHVYFPDGAVLSVMTILTNGSAIETANIGDEGAFGLFEALYTHRSFSQCHVLIPGSLLRFPSGPIKALFENDAYARDTLVRYYEQLRIETQQAAACFALHTIHQRLSRWLLLMDRRLKGRELPLTHDALAHVLGVNRKSVTLALQAMRTSGLITSQRGKIRICDRLRLESAACECYATMKDASHAHPPLLYAP